MNDTAPAAERVQIELLRKAGPVRRLQLALDVSSSVIDLAQRAIARGHAKWSDTEVRMEFVKLNYGSALAGAVKRYLGANTHGQ